MRPMRPFLLFAFAVAAGPALAQTPPADPVVARVNGQEVRISDIDEAARTLPDQYKSMPQNVLYPLLLDQAVDRLALVALARARGVDKDPEVMRQVAHAEEQALQNAIVRRVVVPQITDTQVRARYDTEIASKPGEEEVHARHILVANEADAIKIIAELKKGGDFAATAKARSTDPGAAQGGDLGFFKRGDMLPEFAAAAFAMKPGQITDKPVKTIYGWHVIKVEERRVAPPPAFDSVKDEVRQALVQEAVQRLVVEAHAGVKIEKFNPDGSVPRAIDTAEPPPAPKP